MDEFREPPKIRFDGDDWRAPARFSQTQTPAIIRWVISYSGGLLKDERQAEYLLLGIAALGFIISLFLLFGGESGPSVPSGELYYGGP